MMWRKLIHFIHRVFQMEPVLLCDSCRYDHRGACRRPERPNAIECPDYKRAGG